MSRRFRVSFVTDERRLPTVISLLSGEARQWNIAEIDDKSTPTPIPTNGPIKRERPTTPIFMTRSGKIILDALRANGGKGDKKYIMEALHNANFAASSYSPLTSGLVKEGKLRRTVTGWELADG